MPGIFSRYRYGDVDVFLLDGRYDRSAETNAQGTLLGAGQTAWLEQELLASTVTLKLLATRSIWSPTGNETWLDFPAAREALFDFVRDQGITGVVLLGGDVHRSSLRTIERSSAGGYDLPEIISSRSRTPTPLAPTTPRPTRCSSRVTTRASITRGSTSTRPPAIRASRRASSISRARRSPRGP
jgi:phosphodiesterase/alkaline phosphatase D-like protein